MELKSKVRYFVIKASLIIFTYQLNVALHHLMGEETVDSTDYIPISDLDPPPVISFCPRQKEDKMKLKEWGWYWGQIYGDVRLLLAGKKDENETRETTGFFHSRYIISFL